MTVDSQPHVSVHAVPQSQHSDAVMADWILHCRLKHFCYHIKSLEIPNTITLP